MNLMHYDGAHLDKKLTTPIISKTKHIINLNAIAS